VSLSNYETTPEIQKLKFQVRNHSSPISSLNAWDDPSPLTPALSTSEGEREHPSPPHDNSPVPNRSPLTETLLRLAVLGLILLTVALSAHACGPFFPNNLLGGGDEALLAAPVADFRQELEHMEIQPSRFDYVGTTNAFAQATTDAELADLARALKRASVSDANAAPVIESQRLNRKRLADFVAAYETWESQSWMQGDENRRAERGPEPIIPTFDAVLGLPAEFADYFAGVVAHHDPASDPAEEREAWERLLARPAAERKFKSTWAAFMLGKSWDEEDDDRAVAYFRQTRELGKHGFADSTGLAAAAIGLEARVELRRKHFQRAIELYLEQYATGDNSAVGSLQSTAEAALATGGDGLTALAAEANTRAVITAYLICGERGGRFAAAGSPATNIVSTWLNAVEAANSKDVASAERLALAAYQEGQFEIAQRWVRRARNSPVAQWLQAKLYLRAGKVSQAAGLISQLTDLLPVTAEVASTNSSEFADELRMTNHGYEPGSASARAHLWGELGVLKLGRGEFEQALDALLRAGFWEDAAYVAERVLSGDELKRYVDTEWPTLVAKTNRVTASDATQSPLTNPLVADLRYLLARRLTREMRTQQAREYFPRKWQPRLDELIVALDNGWNENAPTEQRAKSFFAAAWIARTNGMELLGTELSPDWLLRGGGFEEGLTERDRSSNSPNHRLNFASAAELQRATQKHADPEARFHYRYQAAFLAWEAAKLLPDNSDEKARVLCTGGSWLKRRDPDTADIFYKALVRRCRKTAIGEQADHMRWFPVLDEAGNPKPYRSRLEKISMAEAGEGSTEPPPNEPAADEQTIPATEYPLAGQRYVIHSGDSIAAIANAVQQLGPPLTARQILEANPGLDPARLKIGQVILIPTVAAPAVPDDSQ
jgi:LysM domain